MCLYISLQLFVRRIVPYILLGIMRHRNGQYCYYSWSYNTCPRKRPITEIKNFYLFFIYLYFLLLFLLLLFLMGFFVCVCGGGGGV